KSAEFRAGESSRFLATMIDTLPIPVFFKDVEGRYLGCNLPFEDYIGIKRASLIGKTAYDIAPVDLADRYTAADREFFTQPLPQNYETQVQYADGSRHDVIFYKAPFFNKDGSPGGLIGAYIDITGRKVAEEALLESESFNRGLVENLPEYIAVYGIDGKLVYVNPASAKGLGYDADELVGSHVLNYVAAEYHEIVKAKMIARRNDGDTSPYEIDMVTRTGLLRSVIVKATPIQYHNNPAILLLLIDITDRKKSDTVIQRIGQEWQTTFDAITDAVFLLDDTGRIARHNRAFETFTGKTATEIDGRFCYEILHGTAYPFQGCPNVKAPASRKRESLELQIDNRWYLSTVDPILSKNGSSSGAVHLIVDITERKRVEELLQQNQLQLATAMDLAMVVNWEYDVGTGEFTFDDRFYALYGTTAEREGGHRMSAETYAREFVHPEDISRVAGEIQKLLGIADPLYRGQMEHRIIRRDGMIRTVNARYAPVMDTQGKVIRTFGANQDITERKQVEEALRESETQLNEVSEMARVGGWELDLSTKAVRWTRETYRIHEVAEGGTFNLANAIRFYDQPGRTLMEDAVQRCIEHGEPFDLELPFTSARGQHLWTRAMGRAVKIDGKIVKLLGTFQDITERKQAEEVIRSREEQFRVIFHNQQTGLIMVDAENRTVADVNTAALKMIGVSREEILGKVCHTFICPADVGHCPVMDLGQSVDNSERILIRANGEKIPILKSVNPVKINGHPFLIESFIDLSERKKMELQFRESQQLFSDIISFLPDPTFVIDKDGKVLAWNRALEQLSGISAADIIGKGDYEYSLWQYGKRRPLLIDLVLHPDQDAGRMNYTGIRSSGQNVVAQIEITQHGSGHKIPLSLIASPLMDAQGKITGAIESLRDISSLKEAEAELARMNQNLETLVRDRTRLLEDEVSQRKRAEKDVQAALDYTRSVIETNPDLIVVLDDKGTILDINATGEFLTGISKDLLIGTHYFGYLVDDGTLFDTFSALTQKGRLENIIQVRNTSGHLTPLSVHATVIRASDGGKDRIIVAAHDITRQKQDAEAIRASLDEKVLLLREVHHRVKNNLQIIISLVNLQMRQTDDPMVKQIMSETQNRVRAMSLVHEKLYRSESLSRIDFADYTRFLATQLFSFYGTDTRRVHLDFAMREIMVEINTAVPLGLLMNELISNALKHAFPHGREGTITISGGDAGDLVTLIVKDNGIGMPADLDWKDTTSLGMRLVTSLIDQVDGTVTLDRTGGTMFTITIRKKLPQMVPD
ncbi:MAG: PAS domain S-box protein, partial [Methanoregula sp.]|nr:PAS domain S-box protein [Methanoregula sp.]